MLPMTTPFLSASHTQGATIVRPEKAPLRNRPAGTCPAGGTVAHPVGPADARGNSSARTAMRRDGMLAPEAETANSGRNPVRRRTTTRPTGPGDGVDKTSMQRMPPGAGPGGGTVACPAGAADARGNSSDKTAGPRDGTLAPEAETANSGINPVQRRTTSGPTLPGDGAAKTAMQRMPPGTCPGDGTVAHPVGPADAVANNSDETARPGHGTLAPEAETANSGRNPVQRRTTSGPTLPGDGAAKTSMQRLPPGTGPGDGTVAHPVGPADAVANNSDETAGRRDGMLAPEAEIANSGRNPVQGRTTTGPTLPGDGAANTSMQRLPPGTCPLGGTVAHPVGPADAVANNSDETAGPRDGTLASGAGIANSGINPVQRRPTTGLRLRRRPKIAASSRALDRQREHSMPRGTAL